MIQKRRLMKLSTTLFWCVFGIITLPFIIVGIIIHDIIASLIRSDE